jgi:DnaJ like chaperone protein
MYLIVMALADGQLAQVERDILQDIAKQLGFNQLEFNRLLDMVISQTQFSRGGQQYSQHNSGSRQQSASSIQQAYKALGVSADASDQEVKRAYRKLMSQYHPDKLMGQGVPEDMINVATEQAKEIQLAYDLIKKQRNLR